MKKLHDYSNIGAVCADCAKAAGFTPKDKACGGWVSAKYATKRSGATISGTTGIHRRGR